MARAWFVGAKQRRANVWQFLGMQGFNIVPLRAHIVGVALNQPFSGVRSRAEVWQSLIIVHTSAIILNALDSVDSKMSARIRRHSEGSPDRNHHCGSCCFASSSWCTFRCAVKEVNHDIIANSGSYYRHIKLYIYLRDSKNMHLLQT